MVFKWMLLLGVIGWQVEFVGVVWDDGVVVNVYELFIVVDVLVGFVLGG